MSTLQSIMFTVEQQKFISQLINNFGDGQHPYADDLTLDFFTVEYVQE